MEDSWLRTGDLGFVVGDRLHFAGRIAERLVVSGRNLHASDIEAEVSSIDGVRNGCCAAIQDDDDYALVLECTTVLNDSSEHHDFCSAVSNASVERFGARPSRVVVVNRGTLPKTPSGKIQRSLVTENLDNGRLSIRYELGVGHR
jgi:fatty-acyl-CoA synthase